jgi:hypothetical protein
MKTQALRRAAWLTAAALPLMFTPYNTTAAAECEAQVEQSLQELRVPQDDVESVEVVRRKRTPNPPTNYVYDAWVRLGSCGQGHLVVNMTRYCHVLQSYTRGDCQVNGVPHY